MLQTHGVSLFGMIERCLIHICLLHIIQTAVLTNKYIVLFSSLDSSKRSDSSVGIATRYVLDGPGIESWWGDEIFFTRPDRSWAQASLLYYGYRDHYRG